MINILIFRGIDLCKLKKVKKLIWLKRFWGILKIGGRQYRGDIGDGFFMKQGEG